MNAWRPVNTWRNRLAWRLCTWVLNTVATDDYSRCIAGSIRYGMASAVRDITEGRDHLFAAAAHAERGDQ